MPQRLQQEDLPGLRAKDASGLDVQALTFCTFWDVLYTVYIKTRVKEHAIFGSG